MTNQAANRERFVRSIEERLRGLTLTHEQAARIQRAAAISASTDPLGPPRQSPLSDAMFQPGA